MFTTSKHSLYIIPKNDEVLTLGLLIYILDVVNTTQNWFHIVCTALHCIHLEVRASTEGTPLNSTKLYLGLPNCTKQ